MSHDRPIAELVDDLRIEQRRRWSNGERAAVEELFERNPRLLFHAESALELVYAEVLLRAERGESPELEEYAQRFPALADQLGALFEVHRALESGRLLDSTSADTPVEWTASGDARMRVGPMPVVAGYEIKGELGRGGMGVVYKARHVGLNRQVALKMILAGSHAGAVQVVRFQAEAEAVARLQHPNIVQIHDVGVQDGRPFFSLELIEGGSLAQKLDGVPQPAVRAAEWVQTLARAIEVAHQKGVIHRDLKPSNILLASDGTLKITDFGLAKSLGAAAELTGTEPVMGSPSYMAPEQALGKGRDVGPAADIYALGAILYELLTGRPPFRAASVIETLEQVKVAEPVRPGRLQPGLSRDLETICLKCLEKEPARRYSTAGALADELDRFLRHEPIKARPIGRLARAMRWCRHKPALAALIALAALALVTVAVVSVGYGLQQTRAARDLRSALDAARQLSTRLTLERGLALCEQGDVNQGVLWLARSLEMDDRTDHARLESVIRTNLTGWTRCFHHLRHCLDHEGSIGAVAFSPDGAIISTGGKDGTTRLWDAATGRPTGAPLAHAGPVKYLAFSRDGQILLSVAGSKSVALWNPATGAHLSPPLEHPGSVRVAALSPDGRTALTGGDDGTVRFWETRTGTRTGPVLHHRGPVRVAIYSIDGGTVLTGSDDKTAGVWEAATGRLIHSLGHDSPIRAAAFGPGGTMIATGCEDGSARIWEAATGRAVGLPLRHDARVETIGFSPDGRRVLTASRDWRARLWDPVSGALVGAPMRHQDPVTGAAFSPDGHTILTGSLDGTARLWETATTQPVGPPMAHRGEVHAVAFSPDGRCVLTAGSMSAAQLWEIREAETAATIYAYPGWPNAMALSPDGQLAALGGVDFTARVYELATGRAIGEPLRHEDEVQALAFSRGGKIVASGGDDRTARLWDAASGRPIGAPFRHRNKVHSLALSPDDRLVLTGTRSGTACLWDAGTGRLLGEKRGHLGPVSTVAFSRDGRKFVTGGSDQTARLWRTATLEPIGTPLRHQGRVWALAFDPDDRVVATGGADKTLRLWDAATGTPLGSPIVDRAPIRSVAFGPGGQTVFIGCWDGTSRLWDLTRREPLGPPLRHSGITLATAFDRSGARALAGFEDKTTRTYLVPSPMEGEVARIVLSVQLMTNMVIDPDGGVESLDASAWLQRFRRLAAFGGSRGP